MFPLEYIKRVQGYNTFNKKGRWLVLLGIKESSWNIVVDAAAYVPTHSLNLTAYPADFVTISFYKMFGYPTGVGCLIVKNEAIDYMNKVYWGGGSVLQTVSRDEGSIRYMERLLGMMMVDCLIALLVVMKTVVPTSMALCSWNTVSEP